jgi:hypothetical protein
MKNIQYKDIAEYTDKSLNTIKGWKVKFPKLLELVKTGAFCKKNNITIEDIKGCIKMKELAKDNN